MPGMSLSDSDMNSGLLDPYAGAFQKRSDMYLSALSGKMVTITAFLVVLATLRAPARAAPPEMPTRRPSSLAKRLTIVETLRLE